MSVASPPSFLIGLIGQGIQGSRTPALHQQEADAQGLRYLYRLIDIDKLGLTVADLPALLDSAERMGFSGLNITHPCKQAIIPYLDELSDDARAIGAVNTVKFSEGRRFGYNTDAWGFGESFRRALPHAPLDHVLQLGAGGAGAATAHAILKLGARHLALSDPQIARAESLAESLAERFGADAVSVVTDIPTSVNAAQGVIHATPTGMIEHPGLPLPGKLLRPDLWIAEIVYFPLVTDLVREARRLGCPTVDGGGMAVFQAVGAFEIFTGQQADSERMLRHFARMMAE